MFKFNLQISKQNYYTMALLLIIFLSYLLISNINTFKNRYYTEYLKLKEMNFLAENMNIKTISKDEVSVREFLASNGYNIEHLSQREDFIEVSLRDVSGESFAKLSYLLETAGFEIIYIKATDNTGQGKFFVEARIR